MIPFSSNPINPDPPNPRCIHNERRTATPMARGPRRVAVYCRVSTDMEMQEGSFETQMEYLRRRVDDDPGMELAGVYGDKGKSGRSIVARPEFQRLLADCEAGEIDMILTKSISRFARNMADCLDTLRRLRELGVAVFFDNENISSEGRQGDMIISILAALAEHESSSLRQNVVWAICEHNASGKPHFRPSYGYTKARRDWVWHIDEAQARRVRFAFAQAAAGVGYVDIGNALNELEASEGTGRVWTRYRLRNLLSNVAYIGDCQTDRSLIAEGRYGRDPNGQERPSYYIEGHHEPLVSREVFEVVQKRLLSGEMRQTGKAWKRYPRTKSEDV